MSRNALEVTPDLAPRLGAGLPADSPLNRVVDKIISSLAAGTRVFLLEWEGHNVPHGVEVLGRTVRSADAGHFYDGPDVIGTVDWLVVDGGQTGHFQQAVLYVRAGE